MNLRRSSIVALAAGVLVLTACGDAAPPARELAVEAIDSAQVDGRPVSEEVKACMRQEVEDFQVDNDAFEDFDDVAAKAADGQEQALEIMQRFEDALASCTPAG